MASRKKKAPKKKKVIDGFTFDSALEASHYEYFRDHPNITIIKLQPEYVLYPTFQWDDISSGKVVKKTAREAVYHPDFLLEVKGIDRQVVIETKGYARKDYMLRKKSFLRQHPEVYFIEVKGKKLKKDPEPVNVIFDRYK